MFEAKVKTINQAVDDISSRVLPELVTEQKLNEVMFDDYYDFIRSSYGIEMYRSMSRRCFKDLLWSVLFSGKVKSKGIKIGKENMDKIELRLLGNSGKM